MSHYLPMLILAAGAVLVFIIGAIAPAARKLFRTISLLTALAAMIAALCMTPDLGHSLVDTSSYARFFVMLLTGLTFLTLLFGSRYARRRGFERDEFHALMLLSGLGMCLFAASRDWIMAAIGLEMISLPLYVLLAARRGSALSLEAAVKYFVLGAVASVMFFFGAALLYAASGSLDIMQSLAGGNPGLTLLGLGFILGGLSFKLSLAPVHLWTPDVLQGAPAPIAAFLSGGSKVAVFALLLRVTLSASPAVWQAAEPLLWIMAALSMTGGTLGALTQNRVKRMMAYSSVAHMGYLVLALLAARSAGAGPALFAAAAFGIMDVAVFGSLGLLSPVSEDADLIETVRGIGLRHPKQAALLMISLLTLGGLPPTVGFVSKIVVFRASLSAGYFWLSVIGVIWAIVGVFYVLRVLVAMYATDHVNDAGAQTLPTPGFTGWLALALSALLLIGLGILPTPVLSAAAAVLTHLP